MLYFILLCQICRKEGKKYPLLQQLLGQMIKYAFGWMGQMQGIFFFSKYVFERQVFYLNIAGKSFHCSVAWFMVSPFKMFSVVLLVVFTNSACLLQLTDSSARLKDCFFFSRVFENQNFSKKCGTRYSLRCPLRYAQGYAVKKRNTMILKFCWHSI